MLCNELMKNGVECLTETDTIQDAARRMRDLNVGFLPVCDASKKVLGTLTDRDIAVRVCAEDLPANGTRAIDVMSRDLVACRPDDDIRAAERLMGQQHKS